MSFIDTFKPENHVLLGEGVWGKVYDLDDGTVMKIAKEKGGVGSGRLKVLHELKILRGVAGAKQEVSFGIPEVIDSGEFPKGWIYKDEEYVIWMRSTKLAGSVLEINRIESLTDEAKTKIAMSLAGALAEFHDALRASGIELQEDKILTDPDTAKGLSGIDVKRLHAVRNYFAQDDRALKPIHGDFNISNIMFGAELSVSGVLDFAETCLGHDEDDLCSLTSELPFLKEKIVREYERRTGRIIDPVHMAMAEMKRDLISMIICRYRNNDFDEAQAAQARLDHLIHKLVGPVI